MFLKIMAFGVPAHLNIIPDLSLDFEMIENIKKMISCK